MTIRPTDSGTGASGVSAVADRRPTIAVTLGDPRGIGPEVAAAALADRAIADCARFLVIGPDRLDESITWPATADFIPTGEWLSTGEEEAGRVSGAAIERGVQLCLSGEADGLVTGPISKAALHAAGYDFPGHTEFLRDRCGVPDVTMIMAAETTPLGGALRVALLTVHVALRDVPDLLDIDLVLRRTRIAAKALRDWWGIDRPRLALAGVNPHASEGGLFGDEEARVLAPAGEILASDGYADIVGILPADTVFVRCLEGALDAVMTPYHDVGLAVLKTLAGDRGVNVTAGLPFPRTSPDHGTAMDIAGRGVADPSSMKAALVQCIRFSRRGR